jgi:hypothetical protein
MIHILLVEDNPADVLLVREAIRTSPIKADVIIAENGEPVVIESPDCYHRLLK